MNAKRWNDLKSSRDLEHRTKRKRRKEGYLKFLGGKTLHDLSLAQSAQAKPKPTLVVNEDLKVTEKPSVISRIMRLFTRRRG